MKNERQSTKRKSGFIARLASNEAGLSGLRKEGLIFSVTELICEQMEHQGINRVALAKLMGVTKGYVTQMLEGDKNMSLETISTVFHMLGVAVEMKIKKSEY